MWQKSLNFSWSYSQVLILMFQNLYIARYPSFASQLLSIAILPYQALTMEDITNFSSTDLFFLCDMSERLP